MSKITRDDIQRVGDEATLLHFLEEKLNLPISAGTTLAQIALPLPLPFLGLDESITAQIKDCQDFSGLPKEDLGERRPFLIRFKHEQNYPEILRKVAEGLSEKNINPSEIFFICTDENFLPFAFAYFNNSGTQNRQTEVLNIFIWTQGNTRINTGSEHNLSVIFSSQESSPEFDDGPEVEKTASNYGGDPNPSKHLLIKLQNIGIPLSRYGCIHTGINLGYKDAFVIDEYIVEDLTNADPNSANLIELFPDIPRKWRWELRNVIYIPNSKNRRKDDLWAWSRRRCESEAERIFETAYPAISTHMNFYKDNLKKGTNSASLYWEFPSRNILQELEHPKIIYRAAHTSMQAAYDTSHKFLTSATHFIPTTDISLLAILNSKLFDWFARRKYKSPNSRNKQLFFSKRNMEKTPIALQTTEQKLRLSNLVQQILDDPNSPEAPDIEREIDELVYNLYELTNAEIVLIEKGNNP